MRFPVICGIIQDMDGGLVQIIVAAITVCVPALVTILTTKSVKRQANKHSTRQSILQLIMEDKLAVMVENKLPENYQAIIDEYDEYHSCYGNHYIDEKVAEYKEWYKEVTQKLTKAK